MARLKHGRKLSNKQETLACKMRWSDVVDTTHVGNTCAAEKKRQLCVEAVLLVHLP